MRKSIRTLIWLSAALACTAFAQIPPGAVQYLPVLRDVQKTVWPTHPQPATLAAQVEQESCISLKHSKCWNPRAELKTSREYGFGFGQTTVAYNANGTERFNVFKELQMQDAVLRRWRWEDRFDPAMQLRALLVKNKTGYDRITGSATHADHLAFSYAAYNGGMGGLLSDRRLCAGTRGCDDRVWYNNVERTSNKSRTAVHGYGKSFFAINREYVVNVMEVRRRKYDPYFTGK